MIPFNPFFSMELHFFEYFNVACQKERFCFLKCYNMLFSPSCLVPDLHELRLFICLFIFLELAESLSVNWRGSVQICIYSVNLNIKIRVQEILQAVMTNSNAVMADERNHRITISALSIV